MRLENVYEFGFPLRQSKLIEVDRLLDLLEPLGGQGLLVRANLVTLGLTIHRPDDLAPVFVVDFLLEGELEELEEVLDPAEDPPEPGPGEDG